MVTYDNILIIFLPTSPAVPSTSLAVDSISSAVHIDSHLMVAEGFGRFNGIDVLEMACCGKIYFDHNGIHCISIKRGKNIYIDIKYDISRSEWCDHSGKWTITHKCINDLFIYLINN